MLYLSKLAKELLIILFWKHNILFVYKQTIFNSEIISPRWQADYLVAACTPSSLAFFIRLLLWVWFCKTINDFGRLLVSPKLQRSGWIKFKSDPLKTQLQVVVYRLLLISCRRLSFSGDKYQHVLYCRVTIEAVLNFLMYRMNWQTGSGVFHFFCQLCRKYWVVISWKLDVPFLKEYRAITSAE